MMFCHQLGVGYLHIYSSHAGCDLTLLLLLLLLLLLVFDMLLGARVMFKTATMNLHGYRTLLTTTAYDVHIP
jgi:hypothetical protein